MTPPFTVVALIAIYNEEDIIAACLTHLRDQGIASYLLDDGSTDQTVVRAEPFRGNGLIAIEHLPPTSPPTFSLDRILARKEALAGTLDAAWFINHDADEFRESLWAEVDLRGALERVDGLGWNAVDFELFNLEPVGDPATARVDPGDSEAWFSPGAAYDRPQIRAWKRMPGYLDLRSSGGHDTRFEGRRVFPLRFPMRHYPIRSDAHGRRKVLEERLPRFDQAERARGWHVQYDRQAADRFVSSPAGLMRYDSLNARILSALGNRDLEDAQAQVSSLTGTVATLTGSAATLAAQLAASRAALADLEDALAGSQRALTETQTSLTDAHSTLAETRASLADVATVSARQETMLHQHIERMGREKRDAEASLRHVAHELDTVYASRSWRWTRLLRSLARPFVERSR